MKFQLQSINNELGLPALLVLKNINGIPLFHNKLQLRHPIELYNISFDEAMENISLVIDIIKETANKNTFLTKDDNDWQRKLTLLLDHMLDSIIQHLDICKSIICCFFEECDSKQASRVIRLFVKEIRPYRDHIAKIVNKIKHHQRYPRVIYFYNSDVFVPGYFIEGVVKDGIIGPDPEIHENANVAISFYRDIPFHICNLYQVSSILYQTICEIMQVPKIHLNHPVNDKKWSEIVRKSALLPLIFFPDEITKPVPLVKYHVNEQLGVVVTLEFPSKQVRPSTVPAQCRISTSWRVGEVARKIKLPYFGKNTEFITLEN